MADIDEKVSLRLTRAEWSLLHRAFAVYVDDCRHAGAVWSELSLAHKKTNPTELLDFIEEAGTLK